MTKTVPLLPLTLPPLGRRSLRAVCLPPAWGLSTWRPAGSYRRGKFGRATFQSIQNSIEFSRVAAFGQAVRGALSCRGDSGIRGGTVAPPVVPLLHGKVPQPLVDQERTASRVPARANDCDKLL